MQIWNGNIIIRLITKELNMELKDYLDYVNSKKRIIGGSKEHLFMTEN